METVAALPKTLFGTVKKKLQIASSLSLKNCKIFISFSQHGHELITKKVNRFETISSDVIKLSLVVAQFNRRIGLLDKTQLVSPIILM